MTRIRIYSLLIVSLATLGLGGAALRANPPSSADSPAKADSGGALIVRLYAMDRDAAAHLPRAIVEADRVFRKAGLRIQWMDCSTGPAQDPRCETAPARGEVHLRIIPGKGRQELGDALGYAMPLEQGGGVYATVLFGAVTEIRRGTAVSTAQVLGHVIAHEIGHLLLGDVHHSRKGLMAANWDNHDLSSIGRREMRFSNQQTRRVQQGARARMPKPAAEPASMVASATPAPVGSTD